MPQKNSVSYLKKQADRWFSLYIRHRDSQFEYGDWQTQCITCKVVKPLKEMQNGHFISRRVNCLRYDEQNCNGQCPKCNVFNHGELYIYSLELDKRYGEGTAADLLQRSNEYKKFTREDLLAIIKTAKEKIKELQDGTS